MNEFINALYSNARNGRIPEEYDFFGSLIEEWDITWNDHLEETEPRRVKGEWDILPSIGRYGSARPLHRSLPCGTFTR